MKLADLLSALPTSEVHGTLLGGVRQVVADSREVSPGDIFVAIRGLQVDGHDYIPQAVERGAVAVVGERKPGSGWRGVPWITVPNSRVALARLTAASHDYPGRRLRVVGVTGTDGKTTTATLIRGVLQAAGCQVGLISTVAASIGGQDQETGFHTTTPDAPDVQRYLAQMLDAGAEYAVLEATSHGLHQRRVDACEFDVAVITNVAHEHLDYHGSYDEYLRAKARLFRLLSASYRKAGVPKVAVLNADDPSFALLRTFPTDVQVTYGLSPTADVQAEKVLHTMDGLSLTAVTPEGRFRLESPLVGRYNVGNLLATVAVGISQEVSAEAMQRGIESVEGVVGRMETVDLGQDFVVIIDFAHTPQSLERALKTVRELTGGAVTVVFGCAGLRDRAKRPMMGEIAGRLADRVVITAEDPRTEDLAEITDQIAAGVEEAGGREGATYWRIGNRAEAIEFAIQQAAPGDLVIVTGKGHERSMCFGETEHPWSDHAAVEKALRRRLA